MRRSNQPPRPVTEPVAPDLEALATSLGLDEEALHVEVLDEKKLEASELRRSGLRAQLQYLLGRGFTMTRIEELLLEAAKESEEEIHASGSAD